MKINKTNLKVVIMILVTTIIIAPSLPHYAFANTNIDFHPNLSLQQVQVKEAIEELDTIENIEMVDLRETSERAEFTLIMDDEESQITIDKVDGNLYVDGELAVTDIVLDDSESPVEKIEEEKSLNLMTAQSYKTYNIGTDYSTGTWVNKGYKSGSFNVVTVTVTAIAGIISFILTKSPKTSSRTAAGAVLSSLVNIGQYTVLWGMYTYKDKKRNTYKDSLGLFNYKGSTVKNKIVHINHYHGKVY